MSYTEVQEKHVAKIAISRLRAGTQEREYLFLTLSQGKFTGYLDLPGGTMEKTDGSIYECLLRELGEETGAQLLALLKGYITQYNNENEELPYRLVLGDKTVLSLYPYKAYIANLLRDVSIELGDDHSSFEWLTLLEMTQRRNEIVPSLLVMFGLTRARSFVDVAPTV